MRRRAHACIDAHDGRRGSVASISGVPTAASALSSQRCLLLDALNLAAGGFRVFPCHGRGKKPHVKGGWNRATTNPETIRNWWAKWPLANIGLGLRQNELVIDEDGPDAASQMLDLQRLLCALPMTRAVAITGSGGVHRYFRLPDGVVIKNWCKLLAPNVDLKSKGGLVIAPPSFHQSGDQYRWVERPESPADLPELPACWIEHILRLREKPRMAPPSATGRMPAPKPEDAKEVPERAFPWAEKPKGANALTDEALRAFVSQACYRYPILGEGQRNHQQARLLAYFLGAKHLPPYQVRRIGHGWLTIFASKMGTPLEQAKAEQDRHLDRTLQNPDFRPVTTDPHYWNKQLAAFSPASQEEKRDKRVGCFREEEGMFVEFLISHVRMNWERGKTGLIPLTNQQIKDGIKELFGKSWATKTVIKLKDKFISTTASKMKSGKETPEHKATRKELLVREIVGFTGRPSEYRITGLAELLEEARNRR